MLGARPAMCRMAAWYGLRRGRWWGGAVCRGDTSAAGAVAVAWWKLMVGWWARPGRARARR
jgi:hypothetical protein